jgi:hypothetical protein
MKANSLPDDILVKAVAVFRQGNRRGDEAAHSTLDKFLHKIEDGSLSIEAAHNILNDSNKISALIEETRTNLNKTFQARLDDQKEQVLSDAVTQDRLRMQRIEDHVKAAKENTDPKTSGKASFWINMKAGAVYFAAGLVASPVGGILLKKPFDRLDHLVNGQQTVTLPAPPAPPAQGALLIDPKTGKSTNLLDVHITLEKPPAPPHPIRHHRTHHAKAHIAPHS